MPISQCADRVGEALALRMAAHMFDYRIREDQVDTRRCSYMSRQIAGVRRRRRAGNIYFGGFGFEVHNMHGGRTDR